MLVLSRKVGQQIIMEVAGIEIVITALEPRRHSLVTVGIDAPLSVTIYREEFKHIRRGRVQEADQDDRDGTWPEERPSTT